MVKIITDTTSCLHPSVARRYNIPIIPQVINFGEESYLEGVDIDVPTFMDKLMSSTELPKTAAPPPELFAREFDRLTPTGEPILCLHPSLEVSGTVRSAQVAALDFSQSDIRVIDTRFIASPLGVMVERAAEWAEQGKSADEIQSCLNNMIDRCRIYFLVATLEFLAKGGRIGGAAALMGSLLQIKPILTFKDGHVNQFEKARTMRNALARLKDLVVKEISKDGNGYPTVMHGGVPEQGQALADELAERLGLPCVPIFDMPPAIVTHGGPGILGVGFFTI